MNIAHFTDTYLPQRNGVVSHIRDITEKFRQKGHTVKVFAPHPGDEETAKKLKDEGTFLLSSIPFFIYPEYRLTSFQSSAVLEELKQYKPDIIHFHTPSSVAWNGVSFAKKLGVPLVGTFHTYFMEPEFLKIVGAHGVPFLSEILWWYGKMMYEKCDTIICPSEYTKNDLMQRKFKKPVVAISNGIELSSKPVQKPGNYFLYTGRLSPEKNIDNLLEAFALFCKNHSDIQLTITGDGPIRKELEAYSEKLGLNLRVTFTGRMSREELISSQLYEKALAFVSMSTSETQGITILEALNVGVPAIGVKSRSFPELIEGNGILTPSHDPKAFAEAMEQMVTDTKLRETYSQAAKKFIKSHALERTIDKLERLYESLLKTG